MCVGDEDSASVFVTANFNALMANIGRDFGREQGKTVSNLVYFESSSFAVLFC